MNRKRILIVMLSGLLSGCEAKVTNSEVFTSSPSTNDFLSQSNSYFNEDTVSESTQGNEVEVKYISFK